MPTLGDHLQSILKSPTNPPGWPADVFAASVTALIRSGAFRNVGTRFLCEDEVGRTNRVRKLREEAETWKNSCVNYVWEQTDFVQHQWKIAFQRNVGASLESIKDNPEVCEALHTLMALADETFAGIGFRRPQNTAQAQSGTMANDFYRKCAELLSGLDVAEQKSKPSGASLTIDTREDQLRVLPKAQIPPSGLSSRSLSAHVTICPELDVPVKWYIERSPQALSTPDTFNMLLLPWPYEILGSQFTSVAPASYNGSLPFFGYHPIEASTQELLDTIDSLVENAKSETGEIDAVVLPECAISEKQLAVVINHFKKSQNPRTLITGVVNNADFGPPSKLAKNYAAISFPPHGTVVDSCFTQPKLNRWKLTDSQLRTYGLASKLHPEIAWWEGICLNEASMSFFSLRKWLCTCVLVCEDLARHEPAGNLVRSIGPDLVIALLLDGPQIATRWPAYYATTLADDPGCSVLTLSPLGMVVRSKPRDLGHARDESRTIGMWRDPLMGTTSIRLPPGKHAAVLTLVRSPMKCMTADGRAAQLGSGAPTLGSVHFLERDIAKSRAASGSPSGTLEGHI